MVQRTGYIENLENNHAIIVAAAHHKIDQMVKEARDDGLYGSITVCIKFECGLAKSFEHIARGNEKVDEPTI